MTFTSLMREVLVALTSASIVSMAPAVAQPTLRKHCAEPSHEQLSDSTNPHIQKYASVLRAAVWASPQIPVCWDNATEEMREQMAVVRRAVADSWEKHSALQFLDWGRCSKLNEGIRITVSDEGPYTRGLGCQLQVNDLREGVGYLPGGMVLNFTFANWGTERCSNNKEHCIRAVAIHEFGHAIGLAHEQNRPDTPGECARKRDASPVGEPLTPYDPQSRMNYCFDIYNEDNSPLSDLDIDAVQQLYGKP